MSETDRKQGSPRPMGGPGRGGIGAAHGMKPDKKTIRRLFGYILRYRLQITVVLICIAVSALAAALSSLFLRTLIDSYITPLLKQPSPDYSGLLQAILKMALIYLAGIIATYLYNRTMVTVAQGVLKSIRDEMFAHMQTLPISYFDTHSHGDVMSRYTNDTDTLRQMITQSLPQIVNSVVSLTAVFISMLTLSIGLSVFVLIFVFFMLKVVKSLAARSGGFFRKQQEALGDVNGFIEEMVNGEKVIKVFCHEQESMTEFDRKNEELCRNATEANKYANILMPSMNNMGYILYVLLAVIGGSMALSGAPNLCLTGFSVMTLGMIASFLQLSRSFVMPIGQVSQQLSSIIMALAGAERIFQLLDEQPEGDNGRVTLVNARKNEAGELEETVERTEL